MDKLADGRQGAFVFEEAASKDVPRFFANEPVGGKDFASALRQLKRSIHRLK